MRAIRQHRFGGPEVLQLDELPDLDAGPGHVRIAVRAAGVHLLDTTLREGGAGGPFPPPPLPFIPGREVAGIVDAVGDGVDDEWLGRPATAHLGMAHGGYADQAIAPVEALIPLAAATDPAEAVAMVGTGRTALGILAEADLHADDVVLIPAAAGGLGALLIQAARSVGSTVIGAAGGPAKAAVVGELGADLAVDYSQPDWDQQVQSFLCDRRVTAVLDGVGGEIGRQAFELIGPGGRIVLFGYTAGTPTVVATSDLFERGVSATAAVGPRMFARPGGIYSLAVAAVGELEAGRLRPIVHRFSLADAAAAHEALTSRATTGKVVLVP